ncbi:MAG TPA: GGDEF domain-containing protein [Anaerolineales bacterium]|nr:GGDEF domain-containing protein [Anaerolineales bacterium]HNE04264.1 GGDEF domain-containing protein [Anaerolineales bacterium]HNH26926.1 GGDEF domain-containing protein [Anaerolineales bacterium]
MQILNTLNFFTSKNLFKSYKRLGFWQTIILFSGVAFVSVTGIIVPTNMLLGGSIRTGMVINFIVCTTFMPYHLHQILSLMVELDTLRMNIYDKSIRDELTKAYNRRYFFEASKAIENNEALIPQNTSLLLIDIDDFKLLNDTYGHDIGDLALKTLTEESSRLLRTTDVFARYGGDEFICLLPNTKQSQAYEIATRLLESVNKHPFYKKDGNIFLRLSIGIATTTSETKLNDLISLADKALYKSKQNGKNTVEAL